jgi:dienelactone hydrolase
VPPGEAPTPPVPRYPRAVPYHAAPPRHRSSRRRRRLARLARTGAAVVVLVGLVALAVSLATAGGHPSASGRPHTPHAEGTSTTAHRRPSDPARSGRARRPANPPGPPFPVGTTSLGVPDASAGSASGVLATQVWYPAERAGQDAAPARAEGPYPLLVFSQGYDVAVSSYAPLLAEWAAAGFVVAAPTYPDTAPGADLDEADILYHPAELAATISALSSAESLGRLSPLLDGLVEPAEVGVVGHSDGGDVTLAVAEDSCCRDPAVKAAAILSGAELRSFGGAYFTGPALPLLVAQGSDDHELNPVACSVLTYDQAPEPKYYLDLVGAGHLTPYVDPGPERDVVGQVVADFFSAELSGDHGDLAAMAAAANRPGVASLTSAPSAPFPPGDCPGAPS